jgi:hypothetical protein
VVYYARTSGERGEGHRLLYRKRDGGAAAITQHQERKVYGKNEAVKTRSSADRCGAPPAVLLVGLRA